MSQSIVVGATGIVGRAIVEKLLQDALTTKLLTLSRSSGGIIHPKVKHVHLDLSATADAMAEALKGVEADYIYFCAYTARSNASETYNLNRDMLVNFLTALEKTGAAGRVKRFVLTCGLKQYGVHLGEPKQPSIETDGILEGSPWPANFYYQQQRDLADAAARSGFEWVCTLPKDVIGYARGNFMNQGTALGLYCAVCKVLPGSELPFPGNRKNFFSFNTWTSSELHAEFCLWAATAPGAGNNVFNVVNGDTQCWQDLWPRLAGRFGCTVPPAPFTRPRAEKSNQASRYELPSRQPIAAHAEALGIENDRSVLEPATIDLYIDLQKWSKREDVFKAWETIRDQYGLDQSAWDNATWGFMAMAFGREFSTVASMSKARKLGWTGYEDTWESFERALDQLEKEKILPPSK